MQFNFMAQNILGPVEGQGIRKSRENVLWKLCDEFDTNLLPRNLKIQIEDFTYPAMFRDRSTSFIC